MAVLSKGVTAAGQGTLWERAGLEDQLCRWPPWGSTTKLTICHRGNVFAEAQPNP